MRKLLMIVMMATMAVPVMAQDDDPTPHADDNVVNLARTFSKEVFDLNGVPYMRPLVRSVNAVSNSRFFSTAFVPTHVDEPYFRIGLHGMGGFVNDDDKTYAPVMPMEAFEGTEQLRKYCDFKVNGDGAFDFEIRDEDTAAFYYFAIKSLIYDGVQSGRIQVPAESATVLGSMKSHLLLDSATMVELVRGHPIYSMLPPALQEELLHTVGEFPGYNSLPPGGNLSFLGAAVPQFEIGSFYGTELLIRGIPPINMGSNVGDFAFWGIGLKHNISQYFFEEPSVEWAAHERPFDMAVQIVYQGTFLENKIGVTNSTLSAYATFWDFNIHASKSWEDIVDVYAGFSIELFDLESKFKYLLPVQTQWQLGLLRRDVVNTEELEQGLTQDTVFKLVKDPENGYPGDTEPQETTMNMDDVNYKWIFGIRREFGPVAICIDYSFSKFDIFSAGVVYQF